MTVGRYLDGSLPTVRDTVKERIWQRHEKVVRLHLKPTIGKVKLSALDG